MLLIFKIKSLFHFKDLKEYKEWLEINKVEFKGKQYYLNNQLERLKYLIDKELDKAILNHKIKKDN